MTSRDLFWYFKEELPDWDFCYNLEWLLRGAVTPFKTEWLFSQKGEKRNQAEQGTAFIERILCARLHIVSFDSSHLSPPTNL